MEKTKRKKVINLLPMCVLVDGKQVSITFDGFRFWCRKRKLKEEDFSNWPFIHHMDGKTPVDSSKSLNP